MIGISTDAYQILFPGPVDWELWLVRKEEAKLLATQKVDSVLDFDQSIQAARVLAQPTTLQVALPFVSNATDLRTLIQTAQLHVEKQGQEFDNEGIMVAAVFGTPPHTATRIDAPLLKLNHSGISDSIPDIIVPAATLLPLKRNSLAIWKELGNTVIAFERNGSAIYYDKLSGIGEGLADEVFRLTVQLEGNRLINKPEALSLWGDVPKEMLENKLQLRGEIGTRPSPTRISEDSTLRPIWFREHEIRRNSELRKRRRFLFVSAIIGVIGIISAAIFLTSFFQVRSLKNRIAAIRPEVEKIESIRSRWDEVSTGVDPDASFLETWMNIFNLHSISSIKIEKLNISRTTIEVNGNAAGASQVLGFIEELTSSQRFQEYTWEYDPPEMGEGGFATFKITGMK